MTGYVNCPHCRTSLWDDGTLAGQECECPHCRGRMYFPGAVTPAQSFGSGPAAVHHVEHHYHGAEKSPGVAAVLSFLFLGLGQVYNGQFGKTLLFWLGGLTVVLLPVMWIWSIVDAYSSAERINRRAHRRRR